MGETPLFTIGDIVRIKDGCTKSRSAQGFPGLITTITNVDRSAGEVYYMLDMAFCTGVWQSEIEYADISDQNMEYI